MRQKRFFGWKNICGGISICSASLFNVECSSLQKSVKSYNVNQPLQITSSSNIVTMAQKIWFFPKKEQMYKVLSSESNTHHGLSTTASCSSWNLYKKCMLL